MAGIEQIVVHSKAYLVRWIQVPEHQSISWSVQPHKKGINFGIFKHPGTRNGLTPVLPQQENVDESHTLATPALDEVPKPVRRESVNDGSNIVEKLQSVGFKSVAWAGRCEADKVSMGRYDVQEGEGGTFGLVFDNTFSKQTQKNLTFVLITHPTSAPPKSGHHLHYSQALASGSSSSVGASPAHRPAADSTESLTQTNALHRGVLEDPRPVSKGGHFLEVKGVEGTSFYTGVLSKKRRKKGQGFAKRYFSLDFTSSTLSYYRDRHSSALRGAVPLSLAAVGANEKTREFSVDSGAEVWHLKALNKKDFEGWREALERASGTAVSAPPTPAKNFGDGTTRTYFSSAQEGHEWERVERLVSVVSGSRDAVRALARDTDPKYLSESTPGTNESISSPSYLDTHNPYFPDVDDQNLEKRPFWKRKASADRSASTKTHRSVSSQLVVPASIAAGPASPAAAGQAMVQKRASIVPPKAAPAPDVHERCLALLHDLDKVVADFSALILESKARRIPPLPTSASRLSIDSVDDQEFFDADDGARSASQLLKIRRDTESEVEDGHDQQHDRTDDVDSDTSSEAGGAAGSVVFGGVGNLAQSGLLLKKPDSLPPLPLPRAKRRATIQPPKQPPPSIIGFLRKNAGKDLSTVSMPVTANEPTSLLQRLAESMEYTSLLDSAASMDTSPEERLMYVAAFAISYFANNRVKERAIRKPFNPMLGETFELVREDLGYRFLAEKVSHHPVRTACQAESLNNGGWCYTQSPQPVQKFWGKSVELNTEGRARLLLYGSQEHFSWSQATCVLRNVIAGEKYVEPTGTMTIQNETTGMRAVATFRQGGMFSGRSEEVNVQLLGSTDSSLPLGLAGKWTESLKRTDTNATIWTVGGLVPDAPSVYGFTAFAAALNEVTAVEEGRLPPTDSRLRPDQQALEVGDVDKAEALKARLEERQRARRKVLEGHGQTWTPQFFEKVVPSAAATGQQASGGDEEEIWVLKQGAGVGYWERRAAGPEWSGVREVFEV